jgi:glutaconate CoA-transferase, subunit B
MVATGGPGRSTSRGIEWLRHLAPRLARLCEIYIIVRQAPRGFVQRLDFVTSFRNGDGGDHRACLGIRNKEPTKLITDLAIF